MKSALLKKIRKRYEVKIVHDSLILSKNKNNGDVHKYKSICDFTSDMIYILIGFNTWCNWMQRKKQIPKKILWNKN